MRFQTKKRLMGPLVVIAFVIGVAIFPNHTWAAEEIKLGALFDLTGATSDVGWHYVDGVRDYIKYLNEEQGGIGNGVKINLIWTDYQYKIPQAISAYTKFVKRDKVVAILGWGTGDSEALKTKIIKDKIPYISASFSQHLVFPPKWNFLPIGTYADHVRTAMKYINDRWDKPMRPKMAIIYNDTGYGRAVLKPAEVYANALGIDLVAKEIVGLQDLEATSQLLRIKEKAADFVFIQETYTATGTVLKDAKKLGLNDVIFMGNFWGTGMKLVELAGDAAEGYLGVMPFSMWDDDNEGIRFARMLNTKYHSDVQYREPQYMAGIANAMIMVHAVESALKKVEGNPKKVKGSDVFEALEGMKDFDTKGLTIPVSYGPNERRGGKGAKIVTIEGGKISAVTDFLEAPPVPEHEIKGDD